MDQIRNYIAADEQKVVELWNQCLTRDKITLNTFRKKIILDENFDARGCFVAAEGDRIVGFLLSLRRRYPYNDLGLEPGKGWITVFFVHPDHLRHGVGSELLQNAEDFLAREGVRDARVADYTPNYFIPGIDVDAYASGYEFLKRSGYEKVSSVYGMGRSLVDAVVPADMEERFLALASAGFTVDVFKPEHTLKVLEFLRHHYPGDLFRVAHDRLLEDPECDEILVACKDGHVVGFSHFHDERFGPFGIDPEFNGRGLGPMLYYKTVNHMREKGRKNLWLAWTGGRAKDFYHKVGLKVLRRHVIMRKEIGNLPNSGQTKRH